ncbi:hypothetical protein A2Z22_01625 [Candidatus Woesebacteria bacterium RBG_16_34_12]|uniref:Peptidase S11 D-alanyl-D-alanine carboxypeptidase A N-terminal domain-containing protein n=1 Tax=Candidatus Woesebacteria bacterium RBG_16_34_12 TaxID=1802480 RepID=A0A1F7XAC4_9BACT|nr:MAG: hypothetical protein A2Z22_01625 [Candidatus Woesebacteria bacterium RBG_16_34_12]
MKFLCKLARNQLAISCLSFIFITNFSLNFPKKLKPIVKIVPQIFTYRIIPKLVNVASFPVVSAQSVYAVDVDSGISLFEKKPDNLQLPASTTKIITALVALDYYPKDLVLEVGKIKVDGQKMGLLSGEKIKVEDLLYGLLIYSANDSAEVLAQNYPGGRDYFISAMNLKINELGLENTHFVNPVGFDGIGQVTSARDLVKITLSAMENPLIAEIVATKEKEVKSIDGYYVHKLVNLNKLIGQVDGVLGVKTGWTENAQENLVTYVERNNRKIIIALLTSQDRFGETEEIIDWIFENYQWDAVKTQSN